MRDTRAHDGTGFPTPPQLKAIRALERGLAACHREQVYLYNASGTIAAYDRVAVDHYGYAGATDLTKGLRELMTIGESVTVRCPMTLDAGDY